MNEQLKFILKVLNVEKLILIVGINVKENVRKGENGNIIVNVNERKGI